MLEEVPAEAARVLDDMLVMSDTLPESWQSGRFCISSAQNLAQFIASHEGKIDPFSAADIMAAGRLLIELAWFFPDASSVFSKEIGHG